MTTPGVVLDCVICSQTDPLRKWAVLFHRLGELDLGAECLLGWLLFFVRGQIKKENCVRIMYHDAIDVLIL